MFTGLVEALGVVRLAPGSAPGRLVIESPLPAAELSIGDSIAIDGCCLTLVSLEGHAVAFDVGAETSLRTTLGGLRPGQKVHLERALSFGGRLDGHLVAGHVDTVGKVGQLRSAGATRYLQVSVPMEIVRLCAPRGSIAIAGVSLTVTRVGASSVGVALVPHTLANTHLGALTVGKAVNVEVDLIARYVERFVSSSGILPDSRLTEDLLRDKGFA